MNNKDILFICTAHQVNDDRVNHLVHNFKILKEQNLDICLATHSNYGLDKLSDYCDYLVFDKDNYFPSLQDLLDSLEKIDISKFDTNFHAYRNINLGGKETVLKSFFWESHSKSALANFKNAIDIARTRNYKWIVYLEYDTVLPEINLREYFLNKIEEIESQNKNGHGYICEDGRHPLIWPLFFISKTKIFSEDQNLMNVWQESVSNYFQTFGNKSFEEVIDNIIKKNNFILESAFQINSNMGYSIKNMEELSIFHQRDLVKDKINPLDCYYPRFFINKKDNNFYDVELWIIIDKKIPDEKEFKVNIYENDVNVRQLEIHDTHIPSWRLFPIYDNINSSLDKKIKFETIIIFENKEDYIFSCEFNLNQIEKYHLLFHRS